MVSSSPKEQMEAGHESMKIVLTSPTDIPARRSRASQGKSRMAKGTQGMPSWLGTAGASILIVPIQEQGMAPQPRALQPRRMFPAPLMMLQMKSWTGW